MTRMTTTFWRSNWLHDGTFLKTLLRLLLQWRNIITDDLCLWWTQSSICNTRSCSCIGSLSVYSHHNYPPGKREVEVKYLYSRYWTSFIFNTWYMSWIVNDKHLLRQVGLFTISQESEHLGDMILDSNVLPNTIQNEAITDDSKLFSHQQNEEERLRCDILRYLVNRSNGVYHYSIELRTITLDVVGLSFKSSKQEFQETEISLLDLLYSDPKRRFSIIGEGDHISVKRAPLDEDQIDLLVEEWRCLIATFLFESKRIVCLSDIGSR